MSQPPHSPGQPPQNPGQFPGQYQYSGQFPGQVPGGSYPGPSTGQPQAVASPKPKRKKWPWVVGVILLLIIIGSTNRGSDGSSSTSTGGQAASGAQDAPPAFPGATENDKVLQAGQGVNLDGLELTSAPIKAGNSTFGKTLCTKVNYRNGSSRAVPFNGFNWKLQDPNGTILSLTIGGSSNTLNSGDLAPGGKVNGDVCFENKSGTSGQFVVLYEASFFSNDRVAWLNKV